MNKKIISICIGVLLSTEVYAQDFNVQVNSLHYATSINEVEYVSKLIAEDPRLASQLNKEGLTPIHLAIKTNSIRSLKAIFEEKINPNIKNSERETPLVYSIKHNNIAAIEFLLRVGANKKIKDSNGFDAIYYAEKSSKEVKEIFFPKAREIVYQDNPSSTLSKSEIQDFKDTVNIRIDEILEKNKINSKNLREREQETKDKNISQMSLLMGLVKKLQNELDIAKLENEDFKNIIRKLETDNNELYKKVWRAELDIKQLSEDGREFKRKQLMGIYSSEEDVPETNPIVSIDKDVRLIETKEDSIKLINDRFKEIDMEEEVIVEESLILNFKKDN